MEPRTESTFTAIKELVGGIHILKLSSLHVDRFEGQASNYLQGTPAFVQRTT
jgi:hypothetical protein